MSHSRRAGPPALALAVAAVLLACDRLQGSPGSGLAAERRAAIADTLRRQVAAAYDFARGGDVVARLMSLYPDSGPVLSAAAGRVTTTRPELETQIRRFWENVGRNMRDARWEWRETHVEVLSPDAAVMTATYQVPHLTSAGARHVVGGAWTAVFQRQGSRWVIVHEHLSDAPEVLEGRER